MNIQHKRIFSGFMAIMMIFAMLCVPAFADDTVISGTYKESDIKVKVPDSGQAVINPLRLPVQLRDNLEATTGDAYGTITGAQIVTKPMSIINESEVDLQVYAKIVGQARGARLAEAVFDPATNDDKSIFVYLEMALTDLDKDDATTGDVLDPEKFYPVFAAWEAEDYSATAQNQLVMGARVTETAKHLLTLKAADENGDWQVGSVGMFRLAGVASENPRAAWNKDTDGFNATITFSFKPDMTKAIIAANDEKIVFGGTESTTLTAKLSTDTSTVSNVVSVEWDDSELPYGVKLTPSADSKTATLTVESGAAETTGAVTVKAVVTAQNGLTYEVEFKGVEVVGDVKLEVEASPNSITVNASTGDITMDASDATVGDLTVKYKSGGDTKSQTFASVTWTQKSADIDGVTITGNANDTLHIEIDADDVSVKPQKMIFEVEVIDKNGASALCLCGLACGGLFLGVG